MPYPQQTLQPPRYPNQSANSPKRKLAFTPRLPVKFKTHMPPKVMHIRSRMKKTISQRSRQTVSVSKVNPPSPNRPYPVPLRQQLATSYLTQSPPPEAHPHLAPPPPHRRPRSTSQAARPCTAHPQLSQPSTPLSAPLNYKRTLASKTSLPAVATATQHGIPFSPPRPTVSIAAKSSA